MRLSCRLQSGVLVVPGGTSANSALHGNVARWRRWRNGNALARLVCLRCAVTAFGQQGETPLPPSATDTIAPDIPGVVKGGTKVQVIVDGLKHTDGPAAMADGTLLYWDYMERRIGKAEPHGKPSTFLSDTDGSSAIREIAGVLSVSLNEAFRLDKILVDPLLKVKLPKVERDEARALTQFVTPVQ
jgi:hypothetical protein